MSDELSAKAQLQKGIQNANSLEKMESRKAEQGGHELTNWAHEREFKANKMEKPAQYLHEQYMAAEKKDEALDDNFLTKLDDLTTVHRADGSVVDGDIKDMNIVDPRILAPEAVQRAEEHKGTPFAGWSADNAAQHP